MFKKNAHRQSSFASRLDYFDGPWWFRVQGSRLGVRLSKLRISGFGFRVEGLGLIMGFGLGI